MARLFHAALLGCLLTVVASLPAAAQTAAESSAAEAVVQVGPLALTPRFSLRDVGVDTNVHNTAENPQRDFTFSAGPGVDSWLRIGRLWLSSTSAVEWLYYSRTAEQRAFNLQQTLRLDVDMLHVIPHVEAGYDRSRRQLTLELDGRLEETMTHAGVGVEFRPGARTAIDLAGVKRRLTYGDEAFGGVRLADRLNRESQELSLDVRYELTPLTTLVVESGLRQDRFEFDPVRDSNDVRVVPGLEFEPFALISGRAMVGVQRFETRDEGVPDVTGVVAEVDVAYTIRDTVRFTVRATRDVEYSIEPLEPFFVDTGLGVEVVRVIGLYWDVVLRASRNTLAYQATADGELLGRIDRTDRVDRYGFGVGRHLGEDIRVGFDVNHAERRSDLALRGYEGWRTGVSLTYGY